MQVNVCRQMQRLFGLLGELLKDWSILQTDCATTPISGLSLDSRSITQGDLFFALQGLQHHGLSYSRQAIENGAAAVCWESSKEITTNEQLPEQFPCVEIENLQHKLGFIGQRFYHNVSSQMDVVGVTGTDGKTSVSQFIAQALKSLGFSCGVVGTLGYGVYPEYADASHTTPDAIRIHRLLYEFYQHDVKHAVIEASSHGLKQGRLNGVEINTAVFSNLGRDHMDYHPTQEDYGNAKRMLFQSDKLENAVINIDDPFGNQLAKEFSNSLNLISYSIQASRELKNNFINALNINTSVGETCFDIETSWGSASIDSSLVGRFNVSNILAVLGLLLTKGIEFNSAVQAVSDLKTVPGRMEFILFGRAFPAVVIDYAHTPQATY